MLNQSVLNIHSYFGYISNMENESQKNDENKAGVSDADTTAYISQMSPFELSAYRIAKGHLGTSFNLRKSNGFLKWMNKK
jgi:hypothetical protein